MLVGRLRLRATNTNLNYAKYITHLFDELCEWIDIEYYTLFILKSIQFESKDLAIEMRGKEKEPNLFQQKS